MNQYQNSGEKEAEERLLEAYTIMGYVNHIRLKPLVKRNHFDEIFVISINGKKYLARAIDFIDDGYVLRKDAVFDKLTIMPLNNANRFFYFNICSEDLRYPLVRSLNAGLRHRESSYVQSMIRNRVR